MAARQGVSDDLTGLFVRGAEFDSASSLHREENRFCKGIQCEGLRKKADKNEAGRIVLEKKNGFICEISAWLETIQSLKDWKTGA